MLRSPKRGKKTPALKHWKTAIGLLAVSCPWQLSILQIFSCAWAWDQDRRAVAIPSTPIIKAVLTDWLWLTSLTEFSFRMYEPVFVAHTQSQRRRGALRRGPGMSVDIQQGQGPGSVPVNICQPLHTFMIVPCAKFFPSSLPFSIPVLLSGQMAPFPPPPIQLPHPQPLQGHLFLLSTFLFNWWCHE